MEKRKAEAKAAPMFSISCWASYSLNNACLQDLFTDIISSSFASLLTSNKDILIEYSCQMPTELDTHKHHHWKRHLASLSRWIFYSLVALYHRTLISEDAPAGSSPLRTHSASMASNWKRESRSKQRETLVWGWGLRESKLFQSPFLLFLCFVLTKKLS